MITLTIVIALAAIFLVFVWSYPSHYAPNWRDFIIAFSMALCFMVFIYSIFPRRSLGQTGLVILASITVSAFWAALLALAWGQRLSKAAGRRARKEDRPIRDDTIPEMVRQEVLRRDGGTCVRCGSRDGIEFDHIVPVARGGTHEPNNLQLLCRSCHHIKRVRDRIGSREPPRHRIGKNPVT